MYTLHNQNKKLDVCQAPRYLKGAWDKIKKVNFLNKSKSKNIMVLTLKKVKNLLLKKIIIRLFACLW